ncbi:MAG TPA: hypothetical protein VN873_17505 [Candidatus Angelobacter sp.]|nr:hypothetical protein [Candidatus Angelobacter sp.]
MPVNYRKDARKQAPKSEEITKERILTLPRSCAAFGAPISDLARFSGVSFSSCRVEDRRSGGVSGCAHHEVVDMLFESLADLTPL